MSKTILRYEDAKEKILAGLNAIADPVRQTLTPKGGNVIYETAGGPQITNDGAVIANHIERKDETENAIINLVRQAAQRTNFFVGDGTTTSILLAQTTIKEGIKLLDNGWNSMSLKRQIDKASQIISRKILTQAIKPRGVKDLEFVARVSANNDIDISKIVVEAVDIAGEDGLIIIEENPKDETELLKEDGFTIEAGMFSPLFSNQQGKFEAQYRDVKVFITDKRIYTPQEVLSILEPVGREKITDVVIVARDFIGQAPNVFLTNHLQKRMNILLVKDPNLADNNIDSLEDLAAYLDCSVVTDKAGKLTFDTKIEDYGTAKRVLSLGNKTLFWTHKSSSTLKFRIGALKRAIGETKEELEKDKLKKRLSRMTSGTVTLRVGGKTPIEVRERLFRYEDSVHATRSANKDGYVVGGGLVLYNAFRSALTELNTEVEPDIVELIERVCYSPLKQIAENCDLHYPSMIENINKSNGVVGYNAVSEKYEDLAKAGVIEPVMVPKLAFENALSVSSMILSSRYFILEKVEEKDKDK